MIKLTNAPVCLLAGTTLPLTDLKKFDPNGFKKTIAYSIISQHNTSSCTEKGKDLKLRFDAVTSHDITYVGIIQTAKAMGLEKFPIPYILTNCHNSLCAVGGTINEDDHVFGLSAAEKFGGIYVPAHMAVIHTYMRECFAGCGKMILGSDSHTRYGALGTLAIGEGGPEIVKQLLSKTYDITYPDVIGVKLTGKLRLGVGPQDVALLLIKETFKSGFLKNKIVEFFGDGIKNLSAEYRNGIDVMTTETACLSSIWTTDEITCDYLKRMGRKSEYRKLAPQDGAYYDGLIEIDLSLVEPMIALPFHPSNAFTLRDLLSNPFDILSACEIEGQKLLETPKYRLTDKIMSDGRIKVDQAIIAGCAGGTYDNIFEASRILNGKSTGRLTTSVNCSSQAVYLDLLRKGVITSLVSSGVVIKTSFCGPCFGAGDVPANNGLSIRHVTRNFPSREGSKPSDGQIASVALMDARSIATTAMMDGYLTSALDIEYDNVIEPFDFDANAYAKVYSGFGIPKPNSQLIYGPNIADWPKQEPLPNTLCIKIASVIYDAVTTTDELIPSGETSSYRSNPIRLAEFTLGRKDPLYVKTAKSILHDESSRKATGKLPKEYEMAVIKAQCATDDIRIGSSIFAMKPGDGSAREQAASCQRVLGGVANIAVEYATKRYRSNLINWGMLPFCYDNSYPLCKGDILVIKNVLSSLENGVFHASVVRQTTVTDIRLTIGTLTDDEKAIIRAGCLINRDKIC
ncbi:MAG: hydratase [Christensenellaceae bacterium]|jgi:aconitate hydratase|nr:hydratase [Christensenellaceae bacterium]